MPSINTAAAAPLEALATQAPACTPLTGHTDEASAYFVADYPYGRTLRCEIRYWLETAKRGMRFVAQTRNPKTGSWNKPKKSTYSSIAMALYLDEQGHVQYAALGEYDGIEAFESYVARFGQAQTSAAVNVMAYILAKTKYLEDTISGKRFWTMNGKRIARSEHENEADAAELVRWNDLWEQVKD